MSLRQAGRFRVLLVGLLAFFVVVLTAFAPEGGCLGNFPIGLNDGEMFAVYDLLSGDGVAAIAATEFHLRLDASGGQDGHG